MRAMGEAGFNEVHVEAGAGLNAALIQAGCVDELLLYVAPALLGQGLPAFALPAVPGLDDRIRLAWRGGPPGGGGARVSPPGVCRGPGRVACVTRREWGNL